MKKLLLIAVILTVGFLSAYSQKGNNQIGVGADVGIPTGDFADGFGVGFGGYIKGMLGIGTAGQVTLTSGYTTYGMKDDQKTLLGVDKASSSIIPILLGYRHNFTGFYAEPQIGYSILGARVKASGVTVSDSEGAFAWAVGFGYVVSNFDFGARYQSMHKDGASDAIVGIHIGYNFSLNSSGKKK